MNVGEVVKVARLFLNTMNKVSSSQTVLHAPLILRGDGSSPSLVTLQLKISKFFSSMDLALLFVECDANMSYEMNHCSLYFVMFYIISAYWGHFISLQLFISLLAAAPKLWTDLPLVVMLSDSTCVILLLEVTLH